MVLFQIETGAYTMIIEPYRVEFDHRKGYPLSSEKDNISSIK